MRKLIRNSILLIFLIGVGQVTYCQEGNCYHRGYGTAGLKNNFKYTFNKGKSTTMILNMRETGGKPAKIYPNPATDFCYLSINRPLTGNQKAELYSSQGMFLNTINILSSDTKIKLNSYPPAIYYIKIIGDNDYVQTLKLIKL